MNGVNQFEHWTITNSQNTSTENSFGKTLYKCIVTSRKTWLRRSMKSSRNSMMDRAGASNSWLPKYLPLQDVWVLLTPGCDPPSRRPSSARPSRKMNTQTLGEAHVYCFVYSAKFAIESKSKTGQKRSGKRGQNRKPKPSNGPATIGDVPRRRWCRMKKDQRWWWAVLTRSSSWEICFVVGTRSHYFSITVEWKLVLWTEDVVLFLFCWVIWQCGYCGSKTIMLG